MVICVDCCRLLKAMSFYGCLGKNYLICKYATQLCVFSFYPANMALFEIVFITNYIFLFFAFYGPTKFLFIFLHTVGKYYSNSYSDIFCKYIIVAAG